MITGGASRAEGAPPLDQLAALAQLPSSAPLQTCVAAWRLIAQAKAAIEVRSTFSFIGLNGLKWPLHIRTTFAVFCMCES